MAIALLDLGNTNLKIYYVLEHKIIQKETILWSAFDNNRFISKLNNVHKIIMTSVVSDKKRLLQQQILEAKIPLQVVGEDLFTDLKVQVDHPEKVGADRLVGAYESFYRTKGATIIIDLGTALTIDLVSAQKEFLGGIIAPGLRTCSKALELQAPALAGYPLDGIVALPGKNTAQAIRSGLLYLLAGGIEKIVENLLKIAPEARIVATGGDYEKIKNLLNFSAIYEPDLLAYGMLRLSLK